MRTRIASVVLVLGLAFTAAPAFARGGHHTTIQHRTVTKLGDSSRTGNKSGNAEKAEPERKIVDEPDQPRYGNDIVDPEQEPEKPAPKPKTKPKPKTTAKAS